MSKRLISTYRTEFQQNGNTFAIIDDDFRAGKPIMLSGEMVEEAFNNATPEDKEKFKRLISFDLEGEKITITPSTSKQTIEPSEHKNGITEVVVNPTPLETATVTPTTSSQTITPVGEGNVGLSSVNVNAVTSAIDANIVPGNIKKNVQILGVTGTVEEGDLDLLFNRAPTNAQFSSADKWIIKNYFKSLPALTIPSNVTSLYNLFKHYYLSVYPKVICGSSVTNMGWMYGHGNSENGDWREKSVREIDLSGLDTSNVTTMSNMFYSLGSLQTLNLTTFDVSKVTNFSYMFASCGLLNNLDLSNWVFTTTSNINMDSMFNWCTSLTNISLPDNFINAKVTNISRIFTSAAICLDNIDTSDWDVSKVTTAVNAFSSMSHNINLDLSNLSWDSLQNACSMFASCQNLLTINLGNFTGTNVTDTSNMFSSCKKLTSIDLSHFNPSNAVNASAMFQECTVCTAIDIRSWDLTTKVSNKSYMFGQGNSYALPADCLITVKDAACKAWMNTNFSRYTNVQIANE